MPNGPLIFGIIVAIGVMVAFTAFWRMSQGRDPVEARLKQYGVSAELVDADEAGQASSRRPRLPVINRLLAALGLGSSLGSSLTRAGIRLTPAEYTLIMIGAGLLGFAAGALRVGILLGLAAGLVCAYLPVIYMRFAAGRRRRAFTEQVPDILTLLVGGLRAGYGFAQALEALVHRLKPPASDEFGWVVRAVSLGMPINLALNEMAGRIGSDDLDLVVTAINVQNEVGGNLAQTLEVIGETVRERIHMLREIRTLTAQQRYTGYVLAGLPLALAGIMMLIAPSYESQLFQPGWVRILPITAGVMMFIGFLVIRKIVDIEV